MHKTTAANLRNAHGGESMAHQRYLIWGERAASEGFPNVSRLFRAISAAETVHASNHFRELREVRGDFLCASMAVFGLTATSENLQGAIDGETYEIEEMYPTYLETAKYQQEKGAQISFHYALSAEKEHAALFKKAKQAVDGGGDMKLGPVHICPICGWTHEGEAPDVCPICGAKKDKFQTYA
jgi:rubrerythrin